MTRTRRQDCAPHRVDVIIGIPRAGVPVAETPEGLARVFTSVFT
ncbi:MAG TPA: hypothetical protein VG096_06100 [Bryobacteraceae bacterium]|nr:hypothetical protein [Bryobacteraceae bacterium]